MPTNGAATLRGLSDEDLVARARSLPPDLAGPCLEELYGRYRPVVARWCLRVCGDRETARDLAQEVFLRLHQRLGSFRMESRFSSWLYALARNLCINEGMARRRREAESLEEDDASAPVDPAPDAEERLARAEIVARFRRAFARELDPAEAQALYLHHVLGVPVAGITELLRMDNRSGAKALLVSGTRKLRRRFGRWLQAQSAGAARNPG